MLKLGEKRILSANDKFVNSPSSRQQRPLPRNRHPRLRPNHVHARHLHPNRLHRSSPPNRLPLRRDRRLCPLTWYRRLF